MKLVDLPIESRVMFRSIEIKPNRSRLKRLVMFLRRVFS